MERSFWKMIVPYGIMIAALMLTSCSNGSDDDEVPADQAAIEQQDTQSGSGGQSGSENQSGSGGQVGFAEGMPALFDFSLVVNESTSGTFIFTQGQGAEQKRVVVESIASPQGLNRLTGTYDPNTGLTTLNTGNTFTVTMRNLWNEPPKDFTITVNQPITFEENMPVAEENLPTSGSYTVSYPGNSLIVTFSDATVEGSAAQGSVSIQPKDVRAVIYDEITFEDLVGSGGPPTVTSAQRKASLAFLILETIAEQVALSAQSVNVITANSGSIAATGEAVIVGEQVSSTAEPGNLTIVWTDASADGAVGPGDNFVLTFLNDWANGEGALVNDITTGQVDLTNMIRSTTDRDGATVVTSMGYQSNGQGVLLTNLNQIEREENTPGGMDNNVERSFVLNGAYDILFTEAAQ